MLLIVLNKSSYRKSEVLGTVKNMTEANALIEEVLGQSLVNIDNVDMIDIYKVTQVHRVKPKETVKTFEIVRQ